MKNELLRSLVDGKEYKNDELNVSISNVKSYQDAIQITEEYETIMQRQKRNIQSLLHRQGCMFERFKDCNDFLDMPRNN